MTVASLPKKTETETTANCKNCVYFNPSRATCDKPKEVDPEDFCPDFKGKKALPRTRISLEIVNIVQSQLTKRSSATSYRRAYSTVERRKKAFREQSNNQNFRTMFSKLVGSKDNKTK